MTTTIARTEDTTFPWWLVLLEGIFAAFFGLYILIAPGASLLFLVAVLGFYLLIEGILRIVSIFLDSSSWGWKLLGGILGIIAGIVVLNHPLLSLILIPLYVVYIIAFLAIIERILGVVLAFRGGGWGAGITGVLVFVFGLILLANPLIGLAAMPFVLGAFMLVGGVAAVVMSFRMRSGPAATGG
jgi:uncharacterized membrane protein HdeD (DUF308 family)